MAVIIGRSSGAAIVHHVRVDVNANEEIRIVVVRHIRAVGEGNIGVIGTGHDHGGALGTQIIRKFSGD